MTFYRFANTSKTGRNSRIDSLFNILGVNKKHIYNNSDNILSLINEPINWQEVDSKLLVLRNESIDFLNNALNAK